MQTVNEHYEEVEEEERYRHLGEIKIGFKTEERSTVKTRQGLKQRTKNYSKKKNTIRFKTEDKKLQLKTDFKE